MSAPAIVQGDRIMGVCPNHPLPPPAPPVPMPFSAPLTLGFSTNVQIGGKPAAVVGSSGYNIPPHVGTIDAFAAPNMQEGKILSGSVTVQIGGKPAATLQSSCMCCVVPGQLVPSVANVLIG